MLATRLVLSPNSASGDARHQLHALDGAGGKLGGEDLALLIADGLSIDHEADLRVIAEGVEETVAIGGDAARAIGDRLAEAGAGIDGGKLGKLRPVGVDVIGGIHLQQVRAGRLHGDSCLGTGNLQSRLDLDWQGVPDGDILRENGEAGGPHFQVVLVRRNVDQPEGAVRSRCGGLFVIRERIVDAHHGSCDGGAGRVDDYSFDGAGIAQRLCKNPRR